MKREDSKILLFEAGNAEMKEIASYLFTKLMAAGLNPIEVLQMYNGQLYMDEAVMAVVGPTLGTTHGTTAITYTPATADKAASISFKNGETKVVIKEKIECKGTPTENYPYSSQTFDKIEEVAPMILFYAQMYGVPPVAVAGAIADEYNAINSNDFSVFLNRVQDFFITSLPNFAINADAYFNFNSKLLNATRNDIGIGNINVSTASEIYNQYKSFFDQKNWNYSNIIDYISSNEGTVHFATLVIKKAKELLQNEINSYDTATQEAIMVTYFKQGESYIERFKVNKKADTNNQIKPGEGCRVSAQRSNILQRLYKL